MKVCPRQEPSQTVLKNFTWDSLDCFYADDMDMPPTANFPPISPFHTQKLNVDGSVGTCHINGIAKNVPHFPITEHIEVYPMEFPVGPRLWFIGVC